MKNIISPCFVTFKRQDGILNIHFADGIQNFSLWYIPHHQFTSPKESLCDHMERLHSLERNKRRCLKSESE